MPHQGVLAALVSAVVTAMVVSAMVGRWPDTPTLLLGNVGILPFLVAVATVIFLGINSRVAARGLANTQATLEQSRRAELATRFQKGLELLQSAHIATRVGGVVVLRDVAVAAPDQYWPAVQEVMINLIESGSASIADEIKKQAPLAQNFRMRALPGPVTGRDVAQALDTIGLKDVALRKAVLASGLIRPLSISGIAVSGLVLRGLDLRHVRFNQAVFKQAGFHDCDLSDSIVAGKTIGLRMTRCNLVGAEIRLSGSGFKDTGLYMSLCDASGASIKNEPTGLASIRAEQCDVTDAEFFGQSIRLSLCWHIGGEPDVQEPDYYNGEIDHLIDVVDMVAGTPVSVENGFEVYRDALFEDIVG